MSAADAIPLDARPLILATPTERRVAPRCDEYLSLTEQGARVGRCERRQHRDEMHVAAFLDPQSGTERWFEWLAS